MIVLLFFLGWIFSSIPFYFLFSRLKELKRIGLLLLSFICPLLYVGLIALTLTALGIYSIQKILTSLFLLSGSGFIFRQILNKKIYRKQSNSSQRSEFGKIETVLLVVFACFAFYLYSAFPTYYLDGGRDQGQYTIFGIVIAKTGGLHLEVPDTRLIEDIFEDSVLVDYQSIASEFQIGLSDSETYRSPRFFHLLPAYLALGYDLFGLDGLFRVNAVFAFLSVFLFYLISRRMLDPWLGSVATVLYVLNPAQLWNVRSTLSETISQFLILLTVYLIQLFFRKKSPIYMLMVGSVFGISSFVRIDSYIYFPTLTLYSVFLSLYTKDKYKNFLYFLLSFLVISFLSLIYAYFYSKLYLFNLWEFGFLKIVLIAWILSAGILITQYVIHTRYYFLIDRIRITLSKNKKNLRYILFSLFIFVFLFAYFIRPGLKIDINGSGNLKYLAANSLSIFFWYVPFWLFFFLIFACDLFLIRKKNIISSFIFFIGIFLLLVYLLDPGIAPDHFWASRRWMLFSIPFAILGAFIGIRSLEIRNAIFKLTLVFSLSILSIIYTIWRSEMILFQTMMEGYPKGYGSFASVTPNENSFYFTTKRSIASPLRYIYGKNIYLINDTEEFLKKVPKLLQLNKQVFIIQNGGFSGADRDLKFTQIANLILNGKFPVESIHRYPEFLYHKNLNLQTFRIEKADPKVSPEPIEFDWIPAGGGFLSRVGKIEEDGTISATRHQGPLVFGPFLTLPKGRYQIEWIGRNINNAEFDITYNGGSSLLHPRQKGKLADSETLNFEIQDPVIDDLEFRVFVEGKSGVHIQKIRLKRIL
ncbi:glycosyltransferase family 39 protein [Leptospira sarikeiensis]|uniref:Uncharacterized protein n=1 Tax=Leptospira sarikeiensis TaxID=2484943 RepID=A0A4R9K7S8_9LEPT|nr:glycosyltransferase family 39 protein [Leptospira sarikeiensis]TGL61496.1 hypothetical protein EHQ64_11005 [Leptospira sarikeiensis]